MTLEVTEPAPEGDRPTSNDSAATTAPDDNILTAASDTICGRCGGPAAPDGAWCDNCIRECREHTERLDLQRFTELNAGPPEWAAIFYARAGIPVFPLRSGSKVPATRNGFKDASTDLRLIGDHWRQNPSHNIGLATGHKFDVLDVDTKDGRPGNESITRLRLAGLIVGVWAAATTPSGGRHILFTPSGDGNHSDRASGLDFRGLGGYIVGSPSHTIEILKPNGEIDQHEGAYQWEFADPAARDRPFKWSAAMEHLHGPKPRPEHRTAPSGGDIGGLVGFLANAQPGERNNALFWAANRAAENGLPTDELLATAVSIGLSEQEAARTIQSAHKTGLPA
jgi:Bifunctional DNA primase/polymerase, N-terminal